MNIRDATPAELEEELARLHHEAAELGVKYAELKGQFDSVHDRNDDFLAALAEKMDGKSNVEKTRRARLTSAWKGFVDDYHNLCSKLLRVKIEYETKKRAWETIRSILSSRNAERKFSSYGT